MYILVGSQHSLYTGKLRAYLRWKSIPFEEIAASQDVYKNVILPRTGLAFIPVLVAPDNTTVLQDTHAIIHHLEQQYPQSRVLPPTPKQRITSMLLELYGDEWLVMPAMHYRWNFPQQRTYMHYQFGKTSSPDKPYQQQLATGSKVASHFSGMLPALGITPATVPVIEARFNWQLAALQQHFQQLPYLLSPSKPCTGDFGLLGPLYAHIYIDPVPGSLLKCTAPLVADWIERTAGTSPIQHKADSKNIVALQPTDPQQPAQGALRIIRQQEKQQFATSAAASHGGSSAMQKSDSSSGSSAECTNDFPVGDVVPPTLLPLLHHMFLEQMPVIHSTLKALNQWVHKQLAQQQQTTSQQQRQISNQQPPPQQQSGKSKRQPVQPRRGWFVLPRNLGSHTFNLYDPLTGSVAASSSRVLSSYVAWRAAEIVSWYDGLCATDRAAVQQLLQEISAAEKVSASADKVATAATSAEASAAGAIMRSAEEQSDNVHSSQHSCSESVIISGSVDAVAAFADMVHLVHQCGKIERIANHNMVKPSLQYTAKL